MKIKRGRKRKPNVCRVCECAIVRKEGKKQERICNKCATEIVMIKKWRKRSVKEIEQHIQSMEGTINLLEKILSEKGDLK